MEIIVRQRNGSWPRPSSLPAVYFTHDDWDDYGHKTMFQVTLLDPDGERSPIGDVKVMEANQSEGRTQLPADRLERLPDTYCSLGQEFTYYEAIDRLDAAVRDEILEALRDVARFPAIEQAFRTMRAFDTSLLRESSARRALEDARALFANRSAAVAMSFEFETNVGGSAFTATFSFGDSDDIPTRIVAIIGYNGSGKTRFLANLGMVAQADSVQRASAAQNFGRFIGSDPQFSAVVAVSYSAFDTFEVPTGQHGHVYCGLRRFDRRDTNPVGELKSIEDITAEFVSARDVALQRDRRSTFEAAVEPLGLEPSFAAVQVGDLLTLDSAETRRRFESLSTGHKIVLNIVTQLVSKLQPNALVLLDEPEAHLHPPLLAAMLRSITAALRAFSSFGVIATHSPVVLQEIPRRNVRVLHRFGEQTHIGTPAIETFGENVGVLTRHVFSLDASATDHQGVLRELSATHTLGEIQTLFGGELSAEARAFLVSLRTRS